MKAELLFMPKTLQENVEIAIMQAGIKKSFKSLLIKTLIISFFLSFIVLVFFKGPISEAGNKFLITSILYWLASLIIAIAIMLFFLYSYVTVKRNKRTKQLEEVLPDYLQLVSANLGAGMPIDQALWYAIRERFGVLAEEMEIVAKKTLGGMEIESALIEFTNKYNSNLLKKSMLLLIEGLEAGGEVASLVNKIAWNAKEEQILQKEMAADVAAYSIFIGFAALIAAPFLFALSHRIIIVMDEVLSKIDLSAVSTVSTKLPLQNIGAGIGPSEFKIFAFISLALTSIFSAMIVSAVKKGSIKAGLKSIPIYLFTSILLFLIISIILTSFFKKLGI